MAEGSRMSVTAVRPAIGLVVAPPDRLVAVEGVEVVAHKHALLLVGDVVDLASHKFPAERNRNGAVELGEHAVGVDHTAAQLALVLECHKLEQLVFAKRATLGGPVLLPAEICL